MSKFPPGHDDESIIPRSRLKAILSDMESKLEKIQTIFSQTLPGQYTESSEEFATSFWALRHTATEVGSTCTFLIEKLIHDYEQFKEAPDQAKLEQLFSDIQSL